LLLASALYVDFSLLLENIFTDKVLLLLIFIFLVTPVSVIIIKIVITQWNLKTKKGNYYSLAKAGRYIGVLERLFVFAFVVKIFGKLLVSSWLQNLFLDSKI